MSELAKQGNMPLILEIEQAIRAAPQVQLDVEHYQIPGVYVRSLFIPAGVLLTGKIHNTEHISILASGTLKVTNGTESFEVTGPKVFIDLPGVKRMGYAVTDVTFINVIRTDLTEISDIERDVVSDTFDEYETKLLSKG